MSTRMGVSAVMVLKQVAQSCEDQWMACLWHQHGSSCDDACDAAATCLLAAVRAQHQVPVGAITLADVVQTMCLCHLVQYSSLPCCQAGWQHDLD
jgi:hypothetical protein